MHATVPNLSLPIRCLLHLLMHRVTNSNTDAHNLPLTLEQDLVPKVGGQVYGQSLGEESGDPAEDEHVAGD